MVSPATLHYIYDPYCGWCYGAAPLVRSARRVVGVRAHGGGMMAGWQRRAVTPQLRDYVLPHDLHIAQLSGQPFGADYFERLLRDESAVFDSEPPIAAVLAADRVGDRGLDLLARLQTAHYVEGLRIAESSVLVDLAGEVGIAREAFALAFAQVSGDPTQAHIRDSRALLAKLGGRGFPTFALEQGERLAIIDFDAWLGRPDAWQEWLGQQIGLAPATVSPDIYNR